MSELLSYEAILNQQWADLPLPDENRAWADMRRRLDEEEKRRIIPWWRGCAGWGLLAVLLLGMAWWIVRPEKWFSKKQESKTEQADPLNNESNKKEKENIQSADRDAVSNTTDNDTAYALRVKDSLENSRASVNNSTMSPVFPGKKENIKETEEITVKPGRMTGKKKNKDLLKVTGEKDKGKKEGQPVVITGKTDPVINKKPEDVKQEDSIVVTELSYERKKFQEPGMKITAKQIEEAAREDSVKKLQQDSIAQSVTVKKDSTKKKKTAMIHSAGLGLYQQLPVNGQKWSPYSSSGRKTSIADYIPSVFLRVTKPGKWFLQSEFRYGAPQHTREFAFRQTAVTDTNAQGVPFTTTTVKTLRKTFYHQLPLSFNYYILPNWSFGTGMQWNNFYSAIAESDVTRRNDFTQTDSSLGKFIRALKKDSADEFRKSYWQAILQTQYQWKKFTIGARYTIGLQPYINFTLPGGIPREEKNNSLQVFLLYELWRSKANKK